MQTKTVSNEALVRQLRWRYATKQFDPNRRIPAEDWQTLEETLLLSPSSFGLQPWRFLVITDPATRSRLLPFAWNQRQLVDGSHLVVFAIKHNLGPADADAFLDRVVEVRGVTRESLQNYRQMIVGSLFSGLTREQLDAWCARQVYIALGNFMTAAALLGIDTCPMEGFEPAKVDEILGLPARGLTAAVLCVAGYRSPEDKYASLPKVRFAPADVIEHIDG